MFRDVRPTLLFGALLALVARSSAQLLGDDRWCCQADGVILGQTGNLHLGSRLATGGDWDGDGVDDVLALGGLGVVPAQPGPIPTSLYILRNVHGQLVQQLEVSGIEVGWRGADSPGITTSWGFGSVSFVGDLDGDHRDDIAIGAPFRSSSYTGVPDETGAVYLLLSSHSHGIVEQVDVHDEADLVLLGEPHSRFGWSIEGRADLNGDGARDLIVGAPGSIDDASWDPLSGQKGRVCVYLGKGLGGIAASGHVKLYLDAFSIADAQVEGKQGGDRFGYLVRSLGDLDLLPGRKDQLFVGAIQAREQGGAFGYEAKAGGYAQLFRWHAGPGGGLVLRHEFSELPQASFHQGLFGMSAVAVPSLTGDKVPEIAIGAPNYGDDALKYRGAIYVYDGAKPDVLLGGPLQPDPALFPLNANSHFGWDLESVGDFGFPFDGISDLAVGCPGHNLTASTTGPCTEPASYGGLGGGEILVVSGALHITGGGLTVLARYMGDDADGEAPNSKPRLGWSVVAPDLDGDGRRDVLGAAMGAAKNQAPLVPTLLPETGKIAIFLHP